MSIKIVVDLPELPDLYEYTGEYRAPRRGERVLGACGVRVVDTCGSKGRYMIVRLKRWMPKKGQVFWFVTTWGEVLSHPFGTEHSQMWEMGNCFPTEHDAKRVADKVRNLFEYYWRDHVV